MMKGSLLESLGGHRNRLKGGYRDPLVLRSVVCGYRTACLKAGWGRDGGRWLHGSTADGKGLPQDAGRRGADHFGGVETGGMVGKRRKERGETRFC